MSFKYQQWFIDGAIKRPRWTLFKLRTGLVLAFVLVAPFELVFEILRGFDTHRINRIFTSLPTYWRQYRVDIEGVPRYLWEQACAAEFVRVLGPGAGPRLTVEFADALADQQQETYGDNVGDWDTPIDAAQDEIGNW